LVFSLARARQPSSRDLLPKPHPNADGRLHSCKCGQVQ